MAARKASISDLKGGSSVLQGPYMSVRLFPSARIALLTRSALVFQTPGEVDECTEELSQALPRASRQSLRIIVDMRLGPIRVHPALDPAFERFRRETELGFLRSAVIVATPLGRLRADRLHGRTNVPMRVVGSLEDALAFLNE
jgi:hypothetical protein